MIKKIFAFFCFIVLIVLCVGLILLYWPQVIINNTSVQFVARHFFSENELHWNSFDLKVTRIAKLNYEFQVDVTGLKIALKPVSASLPENHVVFVLNFDPRELQVKKIGPVKINNVNFAVESKAEKSQSSFDLEYYVKIFSYLQKITWEDLFVRIQHFEVKTQEKSISGSSALSFEQKKEFNFDVKNIRGLPIVEFSSKFMLNDDRKLFSMHSTSTYANGKSVQADVDYDATKKIHALINLDFQKAKGTVNFVGAVQPQEIDGVLIVRSNLKNDVISSINFNPCAIHLTWGNNLGDLVRLKSECVNNKIKLAPSKDVLALILPESFGFDIALNADISGPKNNKRLSIESTAKIPSLKNDLLAMGGDVHFAGETSLAHFSPDHFQLHFNLMAETEKFQNIVKRLQLTRWSIPAPFNQVDGKLGCTLSGKYLGRAERGSVPVKCFVNLKSANQTYKLNSQGVIELRTENSQFIPRLELLTELDDIKIPIPDLKITEPAPNLVKDKRFVDYNSIIEKPNFKIEYDIKIASKASDAIKVVTNLALDPVPFAVTAHLTHDKPAIGEINFSAFRIGILRREIKVENFRIKLQPDPAKQEITGLVQFKTSDFKVYMDIFGTLEKPLYSFRSVPALPEKDILAVVFFGKTLGELDFDQQKSVDQSEAAFASGVIGLISMYYLSSTPIESISYNPLTNTVAAKFAVREGLSLTIGANTESEGQIGLRQSLGRGWSMESTAIHDDASGLNRGVAMLRWALRY